MSIAEFISEIKRKRERIIDKSKTPSSKGENRIIPTILQETFLSNRTVFLAEV
jgi:hypothetical protein